LIKQKTGEVVVPKTKPDPQPEDKGDKLVRYLSFLRHNSLHLIKDCLNKKEKRRGRHTTY
jgi:hypothetical protein